MYTGIIGSIAEKDTYSRNDIEVRQWRKIRFNYTHSTLLWIFPVCEIIIINDIFFYLFFDIN